MSKINLNEMLALYQVLSFINIETLLTSAIADLSSKDNTRDKENADLIFKAMNTFM